MKKAYSEIAPTPIISAGAAFSAENMRNISEGDFNYWEGEPAKSIMYDLSSVPEEKRQKVCAVWRVCGSYDNIGNYVARDNFPVDYAIEIKSADANEWTTVKEISGNVLSSRQHIIDMKNCECIRLRIKKTEIDGELHIHFDIHGLIGENPDIWLFIGDSITKGTMIAGSGTKLSALVNRIDSRRTPIMINGGIGGLSSVHGRANIDRWLSLYQGRFVGIAYGTNDIWSGQVSKEEYYDNMKYMTDAVITAGKVPMIPMIPYSVNPEVEPFLSDYTAVVERLWDEYGDKLIHGADLYSFLKAHTEYISEDGVHPNQEGYEAIRQLWAEVICTFYREKTF